MWGFGHNRDALRLKQLNVICVAPTVSEMGEWLPNSINYIRRRKARKEERSALVIYRFTKRWGTGYQDVLNNNTSLHEIKFEDESLADSFAKMLIWLVENEYLEFMDKLLSNLIAEKEQEANIKGYDDGLKSAKLIKESIRKEANDEGYKKGYNKGYEEAMHELQENKESK